MDVHNVEVVAVSDLTPHPRNYKSHPDDQLEHIVRSLDLHGFYRNVVIARDGTILAGHGVVEACKRSGRTEVPVIRLDLDPLEARAIQVLASDNEISNLGDVDDRALTDLLRDLAAEDPGLLLGTGYDELQLAALLRTTRSVSELQSFDETAEWVGLPGFEPVEKAPHILVQFDTEEDRDRFWQEVLKQDGKIYQRGRVWSTWWPVRPRQDLSAIKFDPADADDG